MKTDPVDYLIFQQVVYAEYLFHERLFTANLRRISHLISAEFGFENAGKRKYLRKI